MIQCESHSSTLSSYFIKYTEGSCFCSVQDHTFCAFGHCTLHRMQHPLFLALQFKWSESRSNPWKPSEAAPCYQHLSANKAGWLHSSHQKYSMFKKKQKKKKLVAALWIWDLGNETWNFDHIFLTDAINAQMPRGTPRASHFSSGR